MDSRTYAFVFNKPSINDYIMHHGILGQKWGKRNGPPYPLGLSDHSYDEKRFIDNDTNKGYNDDKSISLKRGKKESIEEAVTKVNPSGSRTNCRACAIATVLRLKGYDVEALSSVKGGYLGEAIGSCFKDVKLREMYRASKERITRYFPKHFENGSYGVLAAEFKLKKERFQHAFNWMIKDNSVVFFDGQNSHTDSSFLFDLIDSEKGLEFARLDNLEIKTDGIEQYIKNRT